MGAISLTGVDQTAPVDAQNGATGTSVTPSVTVTTVTDGAWVVDALAFRSTGAGTPTGNPGAGQTQRWSQYNEGGGTATNIRGKGSTEGPKTPSGAVVMDWALSASVDWAISGIAVRPTDARITVLNDIAAADQTVARILRIPVGTPILKGRHVGVDRRGSVVFLDMAILRGDYLSFEIKLKRPKR